ncbi:MAG: ImmA/IrrE family metallo-endopeptidase [Gemmataceae bacterium]
MEDLDREEVVAVLDRMVDELLARAGLAEPPVDAIALAQKHLDMVICVDRTQENRGRAQRAGGKRHIYLRPEPAEERHQWTVAHEIGEHLKAELLERLGVPPEKTPALAGESLANLFAHRLLAPTCWFAEDARAVDFDVLELKRRYRTASHELLAWRFLDLPQACIVTVVDNDRISKRRSNGPRIKSKRLEPVEARCHELVRRTGTPQLQRARGWTVQGWPLHRPDWQREILRSVLDDD